MYLIFVTTGTSLVGDLKEFWKTLGTKFDPNIDSAWTTQGEWATEFAQVQAGPAAEYVAGVVEVAAAKDTAPSSVSAEIRSLFLLLRELEPETRIRIVLLPTNDLKCTFAAQVIKTAIEKIWGDGCASTASRQIDTQLHAIDGLVAEIPTQLVEMGFRNLVNAVQKTLNAARSTCAQPRVIFNVTGGLKGVIPISTLIAVSIGAEIAYVFERADAITRLPRFHFGLTLRDDPAPQFNAFATALRTLAAGPAHASKAL